MQAFDCPRTYCCRRSTFLNRRRHSYFSQEGRHSCLPFHKCAGFTLLELLIAIAIIAILAALILTAAAAVNRRAHDAQVSVDIQNLSKSIALFKNRFGVEPPSSIQMHEAANSWSGDPRSMGLIKQLWPQFDFNIARDINGDGDMTDTFTITGAECLVFFLGGVPTVVSGKGGGAPTGFAQNPSDPFAAGTAGREKFHDFDTTRLYIADTTANKTMNTFKDTLTSQTSPYVYISSYGGVGYDTTELTASGMTDVYRTAAGATAPPWNANSFQIISPGGDGKYGVGGEYEVDNANNLLTGNRSPERDNITNFSAGLLAP